jgi:hypothetical protein
MVRLVLILVFNQDMLKVRVFCYHFDCGQMDEIEMRV